MLPEDYRPPLGSVLVAYLDGNPVGTVATCRMDDARCELKSMFIPPEHRRCGVAAALCGAVIDLARRQGYRAVRLTTGERQPEAHRLYSRFGFLQAAPWDVDPPEGDDYFELALSPP